MKSIVQMLFDASNKLHEDKLNEVKIINRNRKLDTLLNNVPYIELTINEYESSKSASYIIINNLNNEQQIT